MTGTVYFTRTAFPFCIPGFQFGIVLITRTASPSNSGSTPRIIPMLEMLPSAFTTNCTVTRPCVPFFCAFTGYLMFFDKNCIRPDMPPSGNSGICSTTSNTGLSGSSAGGFSHSLSMTIFMLELFSLLTVTGTPIIFPSFFQITIILALSNALKEKLPFFPVIYD